MPAAWSPSPLIPPFRFGTVEHDVYRGAYPKQRNLRYLKRLKLRTILSLVPDPPDPIFRAFCEEQGIKSIHLPVDKVKDNVPLTYSRAVEAVQILIDTENLPIYIHCLDGASVTGLVVCCLRKLQTWSISSAMGEFLRYLRGGVISSEESVFVEKFASEIEILKPIPPWLWEGQVTFKKHPTLKLKFTISPAQAASTNISSSTYGVISSVSGSGGSNTGTGGSGTAAGSSSNISTGNTASSSPSLSVHGAIASFPNQQHQSSDHTGTMVTPIGGIAHSESNSSINGNTVALSSLVTNSAISASAPATANTTHDASGAGAGAASRITTGGNWEKASTSAGASANNAGASPGIVNKNTIRTAEIGSPTGFGSRSTSIATPTTAALARVKRAALLSGQPNVPQDSGGAETTGSNPASSPTMSLSPSKQRGSSSSNPSGSGPGVDSSIEQSTLQTPQGVTTDEGSFSGTGKDQSGEGQPVVLEPAAPIQTLTQDRGTPTPIPKQSPAATPAPTAPEVVDEYYEVSATLRALALEGADF
ncbi:hypothetical protein BGW38_002012 [Lunasporangiospora selenospora]|uniref:Tyrosine phosphatase family protein n=1 Tax=Lunasporangiospora selenospora TaxID=979761 RepID=A0A9P6FT65_9FUNG|nr:hypothetical protein BGW38_002012 [Lunasporangiospora selenospora]